MAQAGLPAVVSSALDTSVGIRAGLALAAALPELPYACGLGTVSLLAADVTQDPLVPDDGAITLRDVRPAPELLDAARRLAGTPGLVAGPAAARARGAGRPNRSVDAPSALARAGVTLPQFWRTASSPETSSRMIAYP